MNLRSLSPTTRGSLYVIAGAVCISFAPLYVRLDDVGPTTVAVYRLLWGALALFPVAILRRERILPDKSAFKVILLASLLFTFDLAAWHQSILHVGPGLATILANFQVFLLALFGVLFYREKLSPRLTLSIPLAFFGLWLLLDVDLAAMPENVAAGLLTGFGAAVFYAGYTLSLRQSQSLDKRLPAIANMAVISLLAAFFSALLALAQGQSLLVPSLDSNLILAFYGISCQGLGWLLLSKGLPLLPASRTGLLMLAQPTLSFVWDVIFFNRATSALGYCGAALALFAIGMGVLDKAPPAKGGSKN